jgi:hypothetical protein
MSIDLDQGDSLVIAVAVRDRHSGTAVDLTGATIKWALVRADGARLVEKQTGSGIAVTDAAGGLFEVRLVPADTDDVAVATYQHAARLWDANGDASVLFQERFRITRKIIP